MMLPSVLERVILKRPGVACSPQPSTTGETVANVTEHFAGVQFDCACKQRGAHHRGGPEGRGNGTGKESCHGDLPFQA